MTGLKTMFLAAGLALAGVGHAQAPADTIAPVAQTDAAAPAGTASAANPPVVKAASGSLAMDNAPAMTPVEHIGMPTPDAIGIQPQVTKNGQRALWMHNVILFPLITVVSLFVLGLLIWVVLRYRQSANPVPSRTSHNTAIEVIWTLAPVLILVLIAIPSIGLLQAQFKPAPKTAITLKAIGNQWYWSYQYPDNGGFEITANMLKEQDQVGKGERFRTAADGPRLLAADNRIVVPVGVPIRLITTSNDVIHSWAVPAFWIKLDAVPGRLNETSFTVEKPGVYFGQCSELCGARHAFMPIAVEAVPAAQFAAWVAAKGGTMPGAANPAPADAGGIPKIGTDAAPAENASAAAADVQSGATTVNASTPAGASNVSNRASGNPAGAGNPGQ